jgi:hypothetical protein
MREDFAESGFVVLPGFLAANELALAVDALPRVFPTPDAFHDDADPERNVRFRSEFGGIVDFPFTDVELSLLAVNERLIDLAELLLDSPSVRVYSIEGWAKYTGAADYDQALHRDYLNHSLLVPSTDQPPSQVEMFLYLSDVGPGHGPPSYVAKNLTAELPALPNWYPRESAGADPDHPTWVSQHARPDLYEHETSASGVAGTVVVYRVETFHRGTALRAPRGARFTLHVNFRRPAAEWIGRRAWTDCANTAEWHEFVTHASPRQLELFGFPSSGHPYWTPATLDGLQLRYPGIDVTPWR